ncbi:MAG: CRISPR-associated endonuclease Cas2 [Bacteroidales bacterium]|nr:CRISPR-associated endonuclease Cas2 [Lachnoclostridium sp.]MCM1383150.1 CRISPR-associated endonuclease Cas2 [Lachnoclostridium sp.]MCM1464624.1 CRISPR-associated endonuclease Cas2 [Bacteroidales bacterium]
MEKEDYFFEINEYANNDKVFVLIIYDITDNKKRLKLSKLLLGYGFRIQKSAFEAVITDKRYKELLERLPAYTSPEDSIRAYKIIGKGQVVTFGKKTETEAEDIIII